MKRNSNRIFAAVFAILMVIVIAIAVAAGSNTGGSGGGASSSSGVTGGDPMTVVSEEDGVTTYADGDTVYQPKAKEIKYDENAKVEYYKGLIYVRLNSNYDDTQLNELAKSVGGKVVGISHGVIPMMQIKVGNAKYSKLKKLVKQLKKHDEVGFADVSQPMYADNNAYENAWESDGTVEEKKPDGRNWWAEAIYAYKAWEYADEKIPESNYPAVGVLEAGDGVKTDEVAKTLGGSFINLAEDVDNTHGFSVSQLIAANPEQDRIRGLASYSDIYYGSLNGTDVKSGNTTVHETASSEVGLGRLMEAMVVNYGCRFVNCSFGHAKCSESYFANHKGELSDYDTYDSYLQAFGKQMEYEAETIFDAIACLCASGEDNFIFVESSGNGLDNSCGSTGVCNASDSGFFNACTEYFYSNRLKLSSDGKYAVEDSQGNSHSFSYEDLRSHIMIVGSAQISGNSETDNNGVDNNNNNNKSRDVDIVMSDWCGYGDNVDMLAPGYDIYLPAYGEGKTGTSFSAPLVTGAAALVWASEPSLTAVEVRERLINSATDQLEDKNANVGVTDDSKKIYHPLLDVAAALQIDDDNVTSEDPSSDPVAGSEDTGDSAEATSSNVAMSMVFDVSGSMDLYSAVSGLTKIASAQKQASDFVSSIEDEGDSDDVSIRIGVASFASDSAENCALTTDADEIVSSINAMGTGGGTNIYAGMEQGINQLNTDDEAVKMMVLLSDGANNTGHTNDEVRELAEQAAQDNITIYTIGYGESYELDEELLRDIAETTGGEYSHEDATNLNQAAVGLYRVLKLAQINASGETLLLDEEGSVQQDETVEVGEATVDENGTLTAHLYWPGSTLQLVLTDPSGNTVDASSANAVVATTDTTVQIKVKDAQTGTWKMSVVGKDVSMDDEPFFAALSHIATQAVSTGGSGGGGGDNAGILLFLFVLVAAVGVFGVFAYSHRRSQ